MQLGRPGTEDSCLQHDVVDGNGLAQSLERQIADLFELYRVLDGNSGATGNQDLPVLRLGAKPGRAFRLPPSPGSAQPGRQAQSAPPPSASCTASRPSFQC